MSKPMSAMLAGRMRRTAETTILLALAAWWPSLSCAAAPAAGDAVPSDSFKVYWLVKAKTPPVIDGDLSDAVWKEAEPLTDWGICNYGRQVGALGEIDFRAAWDDTYLYVGARMCHRRKPADMEEFKRQVADKTQLIFSRECLEIHIDGKLDHETRFQSIVNALSEKWMCWYYDFGWGLLENVDYGFDADWDVAGRIEKDNWTVEVRYALSDIQVKPRVGYMFGLNPCWFNWADTRENGEGYWWQFLTWSTHGDSHHDPSLYGHFILVEEKPKSLEEGLRLAFPDLNKRTIAIQTADGFVVFRRGKTEAVNFGDQVRQEARTARAAWERLSGLFKTAKTTHADYVRNTVLPQQDEALKKVEARLGPGQTPGVGELSACRKEIAGIVANLEDHYWRVNEDILLSALPPPAGK